MFAFRFSLSFLVQFGSRIILQLREKVNGYCFHDYVLSIFRILYANTDILLFFSLSLLHASNPVANLFLALKSDCYSFWNLYEQGGLVTACVQAFNMTGKFLSFQLSS